jgi:hypothetical protein
MRPEQIAKDSEHSQQTAFFCWATLKETLELFPELRYMFAIPNGGERNKIVAAKLRAEGVKAGVLDVFLPVPRGPWKGLFIEFKKPKSGGKSAGSLSEEQKVWIEFLKSQGYGVIVCKKGWDEARELVIDYLTWKE